LVQRIPRVGVDLDQRVVRLLDRALQHHRATDLPGAADPVQDPMLALAILAGVAADLVEGHPGDVAVETTLTLSQRTRPAKARFSGTARRSCRSARRSPPSLVHPHAERGPVFQPPGLRRLDPVARPRRVVALQPGFGFGADHARTAAR
jgi:hypothetical protein